VESKATCRPQRKSLDHNNNACCVKAGATSWSLSKGEVLPRTRFCMSFFCDDMIFPFQRFLNIFCHSPSCCDERWLLPYGGMGGVQQATVNFTLFFEKYEVSSIIGCEKEGHLRIF
jgi:hypothetical protein